MSALAWHRSASGTYETDARGPRGSKLPRLYCARKDAHYPTLWALEARIPGVEHWILVNYHDTLKEAKAAADAHLTRYPHNPEVTA